MDLSFSAEYEKLRREVQAFLAENWTAEDAAWEPTADERNALSGPIRTDPRATEFRRKAAERGYLYRHVPKRYGGGEQSPDPLAGTIIAEEFRKAKAPHEVIGQGPSMLVPTLIEHGTEEQKKKFVEGTILGSIKWCQGYSEPGSGSDLASLRTKGERDGDFWVINGQKIWTSDAQSSDWMFCLVRTEPDAPKHDGISYILIDMKTPGLTVRPLRQMTGTADFNEVFLENVRVPYGNLVGERGRGWIVSRSTLKHERALIGSASMSRRVFDGVVMLAQFTNVRGKPAIQDPVIRDRLVALEAKILASEYHGYRQLTQSARGEEHGMAALVSKLYSTTLGYDVAKLAMDVMGDRGALAP
ncbi:MAG: acyl-CoA dehydrogenase family protein, partial [Alphaproteobacteria bacterium]